MPRIIALKVLFKIFSGDLERPEITTSANEGPEEFSMVTIFC
jgi:hypothetical protein